ncbi:hypothetical protein QTP70_017770 [Hemibagrus guttatus]|uniref:ribonuclease H n=1 Tax=Hemibagrus guttatus TaxID=175788 RepID=A0AAE0QNM3_9TELE|nr:hypothetical protein QTP70_017770 [Hemibagrus guttatus]
MGSFRRPRFMSSPVLSDLARFHASSPALQLSNASIWNSVQSAVIKVFQGGGLQTNELYSLNESIRWLQRTELGSFITEYFQDQLLNKGLAHILEKIQLHDEENCLQALSELWVTFFTEILPTLQAIFYPVQGQELTVRQMALLGFRDQVLLKLSLENMLHTTSYPPAVVQMLLILQGIHEPSGPSKEYYLLERLVNMVISPYLSNYLHKSHRDSSSDLEKAYDRVPREELWYCMRKSGVAEKYVRVVQDMYERSRTVVRCAVGQTDEFKVEVGLHQGSALSPFLFAMVMDQLSEEVRQESPWTMMFADDIVICSESREQVEENLERWRFALERRGMKVSGSKTEYMCVNEREGSGTVRLQGEEVKNVQEFKYLGSTVQSNGECGKEENISENQGEGVQDSDETGHAVWFRDSVTEEETGVRARGSRAEDVEVLFGSDKIGQD